MRCKLPLILVSGIGIDAVHASGPHQAGTTRTGPEPAVWETLPALLEGAGQNMPKWNWTSRNLHTLAGAREEPVRSEARSATNCSIHLSANANLEQQRLWRTEELMITVLDPKEITSPVCQWNGELRKYPAN